MAAACSGVVFALAQLRPDGALDTAFNGTGTVTPDFVGSDECAWGVKLAAPDHIFAAGYQSVNGNTNMALARFETTVFAEVSSFKIFLPVVVR